MRQMLDEASDYFEDLLDCLLDELSEEEQTDYYYAWCKDRLHTVTIRVHSIECEILQYLFSLNAGSPAVVNGDLVLPQLPYSVLPAKGDFLLGCYWILSQARLNVLDLQHCLDGLDPDSWDIQRAFVQDAAMDLSGIRRTFPRWPWQGDPFRE